MSFAGLCLIPIPVSCRSWIIPLTHTPPPIQRATLLKRACQPPLFEREREYLRVKSKTFYDPPTDLMTALALRSSRGRTERSWLWFLLPHSPVSQLNGLAAAAARSSLGNKNCKPNRSWLWFDGVRGMEWGVNFVDGIFCLGGWLFEWKQRIFFQFRIV